MAYKEWNKLGPKDWCHQRNYPWFDNCRNEQHTLKSMKSNQLMNSIQSFTISLTLSGGILLAQTSNPVNYLQDQALSAAVEKIVESSKGSATKTSELQNILSSAQFTVEDRVSSAKALALMPESAGIDALIHSINETVHSEDGTKQVAVDALVLSGDTAIPKLLAFIDQTDYKESQASAVEAIVRITGDKYQEFMESEKAAVSPKVFDALLRFGIKD